MFDWVCLLCTFPMCHSHVRCESKIHEPKKPFSPPNFNYTIRICEQKNETFKTEIVKKIGHFLHSRLFFVSCFQPKICNFSLTWVVRQSHTHTHTANGHKLADNLTNEFHRHWHRLCVCLRMRHKCRTRIRNTLRVPEYTCILNSNHQNMDHMLSVSF